MSWKDRIQHQISKIKEFASGHYRKATGRIPLLNNPEHQFWKSFSRILRKLRWTSLDTYMMRLFILSLLGSLVLFVSLYELTQFFNELKWLPPGTDGNMLFIYHLCNAVYWAGILQPFSFLFASVYVLSKMAQMRELVAIISTGTSIYRASLYIVVFTVLYYIVLIGYIQNNVVFPAYQKKNILGQIIYNHVNPKDMERLKDNNEFSMFGSNNLIYIIGHYYAVTKEMTKVSIVQLRSTRIPDDVLKPLVPNITNYSTNVATNDMEWLLTNVTEMIKERRLVYPDSVNILLRIDCDKAVWDNKTKKWVFNIGTIRFVEGEGERFVVRAFTNESFNFVVDPPYYFEKVWYSMDAMTYQEGKQYIEKLKKSRQEYKGDEASYLSKFSYSLGIIFIVLAGIGIVDLSKRKISFIVNLMLSMLLFVVYYLFFAMGISLASKGTVPPHFGAYSGGVVLGAISFYLYSKAKT